jgi:hypothetical protein
VARISALWSSWRLAICSRIAKVGRVDPQLPSDVTRGQFAAVHLPVDGLARHVRELRGVGWRQ